MRTNRRRSLWLMALLALGAIGLKTAFAQTERPRPPGQEEAYAAASASASVSALPEEATPKEEDGHKPWAPVFEGTFPTTPSDTPAKEDWKDAKIAREARVTEPDCRVYRIREWYKVECSFARFERIGGSSKDVAIGCVKQTADDSFCDPGWLIFPARHGDVRAFTKFSWAKWGPEADATITAQFFAGDPFPMITVEGIRWGF